MRFIIWCRVSGGVTGTREAVLKGKDGQTVFFETKTDAEDEAARLNDSMNNDRSRARFAYWVEEEP